MRWDEVQADRQEQDTGAEIIGVEYLMGLEESIEKNTKNGAGQGLRIRCMS